MINSCINSLPLIIVPLRMHLRLFMQPISTVYVTCLSKAHDNNIDIPAELDLASIFMHNVYCAIVLTSLLIL